VKGASPLPNWSFRTECPIMVHFARLTKLTRRTVRHALNVQDTITIHANTAAVAKSVLSPG
jgi:hypothetical protein